jgi:thiamine-phosphate pyrophosphorylase
VSAVPGLPPALLALSPGTLRGSADARAFAGAAVAALEAGLRGLLLREPLLSDRAFLELAEELAAARARHEGAWLGVHDRAHAALAVGADGLHLGFRSLAPARARELVGERCALGASAHAGDEPAHLAPADYLFLGPVNDTPSKRGWKEPLGFDGFAAERARLERPVWAIGGLLPEHVARLRAADAAGVAVLGGIFGHPRPAERARAYLDALEG